MRKAFASEQEVLRYLLGDAPGPRTLHDEVELVLPEGCDLPFSTLYSDNSPERTPIWRFIDLSNDALVADGGRIDWRTLYLLRWGARHLLLQDVRDVERSRKAAHGKLVKKLERIGESLGALFEDEELQTKAALQEALGVRDALVLAHLLWLRLDQDQILPMPPTKLGEASVPSGLDLTQKLWAPLKRPTGRGTRGTPYGSRRFAVACHRAGLTDSEEIAMLAALEPECQFGAGSSYLRGQQDEATRHWYSTVSHARNDGHL